MRKSFSLVQDILFIGYSDILPAHSRKIWLKRYRKLYNLLFFDDGLRRKLVVSHHIQTTKVYPSSLCHRIDVDSLGLFEVALKVEGPEHCGAFLVDEEATSLEAVGVAGCHESVPVEKNSSDASVARVVW